jgi:hypothetical protein
MRATAAVRRMSRAQWEARAVVLAEEGHLVHSARLLGTGVHGERLWRVPSKSTGSCYVVHVWQHAGALCTCTAGLYGRACSHVGAALLGERQREAEAEAGHPQLQAPRPYPDNRAVSIFK